MKRVTTLLMAALMVLGAAGLASAVEFTASGHMHVLLGVKDNDPGENPNGDYDEDNDEDNFYAAQRFRPKLTMKGEGVTAVFESQAHQAYWGSDWATNSPTIDFKVRNAYINFVVPGTPVSLKMGFQQISLPGYFGNPIFDDRVGGVVATIPVSDQIAVAAFWARPRASNPNGTTVKAAYNSVDMFGALAPMNFGMVQATPYFVYAKVGVDAIAPGTHENDAMYAGGVNLALSPVDALTVNFDAMFTNYDSDDSARDIGLGWLVAFAVDYQMPFGTPGVFGWYSPGADDDGEGHLVVLDDGGEGFWPTSYGYEGYATFDRGGVIGSWGQNSWGVGLQVAEMSFLDGLSHVARVAYIRGTTDKDLAFTPIGMHDGWTEDDSFIEFNFDSTWNIYENLAAYFDMGLILPDLEDGQDDMTWRAQVTFAFNF